MSRAAALLLALAAWPGMAWADAFSAIALAAQWASAAGYITALTATYVAIAVVVVGAANARRQQRKAAARARASYNAGLEDRSVSLLQALPPWRVVYGRCITGGDIVAIFASDKTSTRPSGTSYTRPDAYKHLVIVFAAHQCQAIHDLYIDGEPVGALDGNGHPTGGAFLSTVTEYRELSLASGGSTTQLYAVTVLSCVLANPPDSTSPTAASYTVTGGGLTINNTEGADVVVSFTMPVPKPAVRISTGLGSDSQTVNTYLNSVVPTQWTSNHRLRGLCYAVVTLDLEDARFQGGPPNITADMSGKLVLDTRTSTTAWSSNPALIVRDCLVAPWGYECAAGDIDTTYCNAAANACDALIDLDVGGVITANQPTFTCNGAFSTEASREATLEDLVESMAGFAIYGAKWQIMAGAWTPTVMDIGDAEVMGQIEVLQADAGMQEAYNGVRGVYIPAGKAVPAEIEPYQNATFLAADGVALWSDITLPWTDNKARARNLSRIFVERARNALVIRVPAKFSAWPLQAGDRVRVTSAEYGWSLKNFRVTDWQFGVTSPVLLTLQEDEAAVYDLADAASADPTPNSNLPNPWAVSTPGSVAAASGTSHLVRLPDGTIQTRVRVSWAAITDSYVVDGTGHVQVTWRRFARDPADVFQTLVVSGNETSAYLTGVSAFDLLTIQVTAVNGLGARSSPAVVLHQVIGKSAAPGNVASLTATIIAQGVSLTWDANVEVDHAETELKFGASWAAGTRIFKGNTTVFQWINPPVGAYTIWAKHFDTSGNESATAATVAATVLYQGDVNATFGPALNGNPQCSVIGLGGWSTFSGANVLLQTGISGGVSGTTSLRSESSGVNHTFDATKQIPYDRDKAYRFSVLLRRSEAAFNGGVYLGLLQFDSAGAAQPAWGTYLTVSLPAGQLTGSFERYTFTIPPNHSGMNAGCMFFAPDVVLGYNPGSLTGYAEMQDCRLEELPLDAVSFVQATKNMSIFGRSLMQTSTDPTGGAWANSVHSGESHVGGAFCSANANDTTHSIIFGLNTDPLTDNSWASIDYGWYFSASNNIYAVTSGVISAILSTYTTADKLTLTYDGLRVRWFKNGNLLHSIAAPSNLRLYFDSSFGELGARINFVEFGPLTAINPGSLPEQGQGGALNSDPGCTDLTAWEVRSGVTVVSITDGNAGLTCLRFTGGDQFAQSKSVSGAPGKVYRASAWKRKTSGTGISYLRVHCYNAAGTLIGFAIGVEGVTLTSSWVRWQGTIVAPAGTVSVAIALEENHVGPGGSGVTDVQDARLEEVINTDLLAGEAATKVLNYTGTSGSIGYGLGPDIGGDTTTTVLTGSYTNDTAATVNVQFEAVIIDARLGSYNGLYADMTMEHKWDYTSTSSGSGSQNFLGRLPDPALVGTESRISAASVGQMSLLAGDTVTVNMKVRFAHNRASSVAWEATGLRIAAIKK